jgi:hypothetical protein
LVTLLMLDGTHDERKNNGRSGRDREPDDDDLPFTNEDNSFGQAPAGLGEHGRIRRATRSG